MFQLKKELVLECSGDGIVWMKMNGTDYALVEFGNFYKIKKVAAYRCHR